MVQGVAGIFEEYAAKYGIGANKPGSSSVAGPTGLRQITGGQQPGGRNGSAFENYAAQYGVTGGQVPMQGTYNQWYTGQNLEGPANGWDTKFMERAQSQYVDSLERGDTLQRFQRDDAYGVVTWDNAQGKGTTFGFGDIVADGKKVGNVYEDFDRHTANVMMGEWLIQDGTKKARLNRAGDYEKAWDEEITRLRAESTKQAEAAPRHQRLQEGAEKRAEEENVFAIGMAGAGGGVTLGATGFLAGPIVGTITTVGMGIAGFVGAVMNQDSLAYQIARERERLDMIRENDHAGQEFSQTASSLAQLTYSTALSPFANLVQGGVDMATSDFDASSGGAFYDTNQAGERTASGAVQAAEVVARGLDSVLTFANPVGRNVYMAQMGVGISGRAAGLLPGVGGWDQSTSQMDSVWTDGQGNFDLGSAAAGVGYVGVEAVQLGGVKGLFAPLTRQVGRQGQGNIFSRANLSREQRKALKEGGALEQLAGWKFVTNADGQLVGKGKTSLAMLAPSEALQSLSAKAIARRQAAQNKGAISSEKLHQAAFELSVGAKPIQTMMVNAFGEAQEEGLQTILEPLSHNAAIDAEEVYRAAASGFASGFGMGAGSVLTRPSGDQRMFAQAQVASMVRRGQPMDRKEWDGMSELQKRAYVRSSFDLADNVVEAGWDKMERDWDAAVQGDVVAANRVRDWFKKQSETQLAKGTKATDASHTIVMLDDKRFRSDVVATSHTQLLQDQKNRTQGIIAQIENMRPELERLTAQAAATPGDEQVQSRVQEMTRNLQQLEGMRDLSRRLEEFVEAGVVRIDAAVEAQDWAESRRIINAMNDRLMAAYDFGDVGELIPPDATDAVRMALAKAVSRVTTRHPEDSSASFQSFVPQVDYIFAENKANGLAAVSALTNAAMRSDYDGDKVHQLQQLVVNDKEYIDLRSGATLIGADTMPEIGTTAAEMNLIDQVRVAFTHPNQSIQALAAWVGADIENTLRSWYDGVIDDRILTDVANEAERTLREGGDVRRVVLQMMTTLAPQQLMEIGRGGGFQGRRFSNQYFEIARMVSEKLEDFQTRYALHRDRESRVDLGTSVVKASATSTESQTRRGVEAGTQAGTIVEVTPGDNMMRMFQKLHYQLMASTELYVGWANDNRDFQQLAEFYEQNGRDAVGLDLTGLPANDEIVGEVLRRLKALSKDRSFLESRGLTDAANLAGLANLETAQFVYEQHPDTGTMEKKFTGKRVTVAQAFLYEALNSYRRKYNSVWESDPQVRSPYFRLLGLTAPPAQGAQRQAGAERAFVEIFESVPLYDILGEEAASVGITTTVGQFYRRVLDVSPEQRSAEHAALSNKGAYRKRIDDKTNKQNMPYRWSAMGDGEVTVFRSLVDSVFSAASSRISQTREGKTAGELTGTMVTESDAVGSKFRSTHQAFREVLRKQMKTGKQDADTVRNFIELNIDGIGDLAMRIIPDSVMPIVYKGQRDGKPFFARWFYEMLAESNSEVAEMSFRRNIWIDGWRAMEAGLDVDSEGNDKGIQRDRLKSRFHRVMYDALTQPSGDTTAFEELMYQLNTATSVKEFMRWLNNESFLTGTGAPLLAWVDDTADFDATKTGDGWTQEKSTAQIVEDLEQLRKFAANAAGKIDETKARREKDGNIVRRMRLAQQEEAGTLPRGVAVHDRDRLQWQQFKAAVEQAGKRDLAYGPRAMVLTTAISAYGMYGQAHTKGSNPEHLAAVQQLEAVLGAFGYTVNLERLVGDVTSHNEDAVAASPELIVRDGGRMTDRHGNQVEWNVDSPLQLLEMMEDKAEHIDLVVTMLAPQVMELGFDNRPQRQMLYGNSLADVLSSTSSKKLYNDNGRPGLTQAMRYLSTLESKTRGAGANMVQQRVTEMVIARTSALDHSASLSEIQDMTIQAYIDLATVLQDIGRTQPGPNAPDPLDFAWENLQQALGEQMAANYFQVSPDSPLAELSQGDIANLVKIQVTKKYADRIEKMQEAATQQATPAEAQAYIDLAEDLQAQMDADLARVDSMVSGNVHKTVIDTFSYDPGASNAEKALRQSEMIRFVARNGDTLIGMGEAMPIMQKVMRALYDDRGQGNPTPNLTDEQWQTLSNHIISMELQKLVTVGIPRNAPPAYPSAPEQGNLDKRRYFDPTWAYLADFLDTSNGVDPLVRAAREEAVVAGKAAFERSETEILNSVLRTIYRKDSLGQWTAVIPIQSVESYDLLNGASSAPAISMAGLITQRQGVIAAATTRTHEVPPKDMDSTTTLLWSDLNWLDNKVPSPKAAAKGVPNIYDHTVGVTLPDGRTIETPLAKVNKRFARKITLTYTDPTQGKQTVDVTADPQFSYLWGPTTDSPQWPQDMRVVDLDHMRVHAERMARDLTGGDKDAMDAVLDSFAFDIEYLHPDTQPATENYYNNLWFEGTVFSSAGDVSDSLLYSLWFGTGGINAMVQQAALDSRKKGWAGISSFKHPRRRTIEQIEAQGETDFAAMLHEKTRLIMETDLGGKVGVLDHDYYNAIYKLMKMKHYVDGTVDGNRVRLTAEQIIENQAKFGQQDPGYYDANGNKIDDATLWIPSDQVLTSMLAEGSAIGFGGVPTQLHQRLTTNLDEVPAYQGIRDDMPFGPSEISWSRKLTDTAVANVRSMFETKTNLELDPVQRSKFREKWKTFRYHRAQVQEERRDQRRRGFDPQQNLRSTAEIASQWMSTEDVTMRIPSASWLEMPARETLAANRAALQGYMTWQANETGGTVTGWVFQEDGNRTGADSGLLTAENIDSIPMMPGDMVFMDMSVYDRMYPDAKDAYEAAVKRIRQLAARNVAIMPLSSSGPVGLASEMSAHLVESLGYVRYRDNPRILIPEVMTGRQFMNAAAARGSLLNRAGVTIRRQRLFGLLKDRNLEENTMAVPVRDGVPSRMQTVQLTADLLPLNVSSRFGVPQTREHLDMMRRHLQGINLDAEALASLKERLRSDKGKTTTGYDDFDRAWDHLMARIDDMVERGTTLPANGEEFGTGDFIPLMSDRGELLLYRHGYKFPYKSFDDQIRSNAPGREGRSMVAVYQGEMVPNATTHRGIVRGTSNKQKYGLQLNLEIDSNQFGQKSVVEINGMKWLQTGLGDQFVEPAVPLLGAGPDAIYVDGYGSLHDALSKQATDGIVTNFRNGFAVFGSDHLLDDVARFFGVDRTQALDIMRSVSRAPDKRSVEEIKNLQDLLTGSNAHMNLVASLVPTLGSMEIAGDWMNRLGDNTTEAFVTRAMLLYLMAEGSSLDSIQYSSGFYIDSKIEPDAVTQRMDELFTRMFDKLEVGSPVREEMFDRFNKKLGKLGGEGWFLDQSWTLYGRNAAGEDIEMLLDFGEVHVSDDNPELNVQAQDRRIKQGTGMHSAWVTEFGLGGDTFVDPKVLKKLDRPMSGVPEDRVARGEIWDSLTNIDARRDLDKLADPSTHGPGSHWQRRTQLEQKYAGQAIQRMVAYRRAIDWDQESLREDKEQIATKRSELIRALGLTDAEIGLVDFFVRQMLYQPGAMPGQTDYEDRFDANDVITALDQMMQDVAKGRVPTYSAEGPHLITEYDLRFLYDAARRGGGFRLLKKEGDPDSVVGDDYGEWVSVAIGQAFNPDVTVDEMTRLDLDGHMLTYEPMLREQGHFLDITLDKELQERLLDPTTNELKAVTTSPIQEDRLAELVILPRTEMGFEGLRRGVGTAETQEGIAALKKGYQAHSRRRKAEFRRKNKMRPTEATPARDYLAHGTNMVDSSSDMHSLSRILIALRHGTTMLNPGLYASMLPERGFRTYLNGMANLLTGEATSTRVGGLAATMRISQYSPEEIRQLNRLYHRMAKDGTFAGMIIKDMVWQQPKGDSAGRFVRGVEKFAAVGNRWQDPTWGVPQRLMAQHYVESILRQIAARPISNVMTMDAAIAALEQDPGYFAKNHPEMHQLASNAVVDIRGLRNTIFSLGAKALYEPLTRSSSPTLNFAGTLLKLPLMYANFSANMLTTITGMQGFSQMASLVLDGRQTPGTLLHRINKKLKGEEISVEDDIRFDMSSTLDGYTIANAFIRGGVTQTGLFTIAMLTGGLFSGEDEEARRRRRLAKAQNLPYIADPRRLEADFRNKDMFFLDWLPEPMKAFFMLAEPNEAQEGRAAVQISWVMKPFLSPILGVEKFIQTGDFGWVTYGFADAIGSLPLVNKQMWDDAVRSVDELQALAAEQQELGTPEATRNTMYLLISAFGLYERMLFENMLVNSVYTGFDTWDRDPTKLTLKDSDGVNQVLTDGTPRENDLTLETFVDKDGNVKEGYANRSEWDRLMAYYSENNFSAMAMLSLFTGFQKGLNRYSMPVKVREIELPQITTEEAKKVVATALEQAWAANGNVPQNLSLQEITKEISSEAAQAGDWDTYNNVDAIAEAIYSDPELNPPWSAMSVLDENGNETLTTNGMATILDGLRKGSLDLDHPAMRGVSIPFEMRQQIQDEFLADVMQEGLDMGLTKTQASYRAQRLLTGPRDDSSVVGFADILWDDRIPYGNKRPYKQLNTTYVQGPDGFPMATGFKRGSLLQQIGLPIRANLGPPGSTTAGSRMNTVDLTLGINTGFRGLVPMHETEKIPTDKEIGDAIIEAIENLELEVDDYEPFDNKKNTGRFYRGGGWRRFPRYGRRGGYSRGGGYGGGGSPTIYFSRMPYLARGTNVFGDSTRNIFWDDVRPRRMRIRRERAQSKRGRLNQWQ